MIDVGRRFLRRPSAVLGLAMVALVLCAALLAPVIAPYAPGAQDLGHTTADPSWRHWFGTDQLGRDQLARVLYGARVAVEVGLASVSLAVVIGVVLGALAGALGGAWDSVVMRLADAFLAFPLLLGAILVILLLGRGVPTVVLALGLFSWATVARLLRGSVLSVRETGYVEAARSLGASRWRVVTRHVLPNAVAPVIVYAAVSVAGAIVAEAALSFLGIGVNLETPDWGAMIAAGRVFFEFKDHLWLLPSLAVVFTVLGFVLVGDGLRDALDPRGRQR
ncbi:MAG: ABC transporter permease [Acidimicrobiales bacterium]